MEGRIADLTADQKTLLFERRPSDEADVQQATRALLDDVRARGDDALRELATAPADLMVIDGNMPGRDGYDIIRTVRADARHANMPVILLTAGDLAEARTKAAGLGVTDFCTKPFVPSALAARAKAILES